ncbi:hypothetical protein AMST5_00352 [freshwater sediment metagenome]|uniref:Uncharacterized protein n=1 Tax=freshwater sediment metagenome TaxID=556182 RepID=A0AA48RBQ5_9ZZZZ
MPQIMRLHQHFTKLCTIIVTSGDLPELQGSAHDTPSNVPHAVSHLPFRHDGGRERSTILKHNHYNVLLSKKVAFYLLTCDVTPGPASDFAFASPLVSGRARVH